MHVHNKTSGTVTSLTRTFMLQSTSSKAAFARDLQVDAAAVISETAGGSELLAQLSKLGTSGAHPRNAERDLFRRLPHLGRLLPVVRVLAPTV